MAETISRNKPKCDQNEQNGAQAKKTMPKFKHILQHGGITRSRSKLIRIIQSQDFFCVHFAFIPIGRFRLFVVLSVLFLSSSCANFFFWKTIYRITFARPNDKWFGSVFLTCFAPISVSFGNQSRMWRAFEKKDRRAEIEIRSKVNSAKCWSESVSSERN